MESGGARCDRREASGQGKGQCNRQTGRTSMRTHCGNIWRRGCPLPKSRRRSMPSSRPPIPAMPTRWPRRRRKKAAGLHKPRERHAPEFITRMPVAKRTEAPKLRCVELVPRHLSLLDLEASDCRYPYGGEADGEAITFCGHPRREDSSYCTPHFHLTRAPFTPWKRRVTKGSLRLVEVESKSERRERQSRFSFQRS
ncbi:MAG: hypothetical protein E6G79_02670 [Alphaproteobacteria bacterium]|nr:MAG: hypothetical protein E6G79_02670 [Alphaproteobacteria bacterium]